MKVGHGVVFGVLAGALLAGCSDAGDTANQATADGGSGGAATAVDGGHDDPALTVVTTSGPVHGKVDGGTRAYLGIPFAAPPTGARRFRPPAAPEPWTAVRDATEPAKVCPQNSLGGPVFDANSTEDCLTLNVWVPNVANPSKLPVMVWIHGGAFIFGSGADAFYAGTHLAEAGETIVVTVNYRLGALGFLALPELTAEDPSHPTSGNYGVLDQQAALRWVRDNITSFGGDPDAVTIFGESAGGFSVCAHLVAPGSQGLFARAISQSGLCNGYLRQTRASAETQGTAFAKVLGCTEPTKVLECLRSKDTKEIAAAQLTIGPALPGGIFFQVPLQDGPSGPTGLAVWNPMVDGTVLTTPIAEVGAGFKVPLMLGTNADEGTLFTAGGVLGGSGVADEAEYRAALGRRLDAATVELVVKEYPISAYSSATDALNAVMTDSAFACPARRLARAAAAAGGRVYLYSYDHAPAKSFNSTLGVFHSSELGFLFNQNYPLAPPAPEEAALVTTLQGYWTRFARTGDPNGAGAATWPAYTAATDASLSIDLPTSASQAGYKQGPCDFWDSVRQAP